MITLVANFTVKENKIDEFITLTDRLVDGSKKRRRLLIFYS